MALASSSTVSAVGPRAARRIIIGTAGHIDHGKTALVKALTGIDADRLQEEKRRGITIDIGFAHLELATPNGEPLRLGFVDVPGHERFVRNMLAGIGGIDLVLFVVAADEGIKPQTREHFEICRLLQVPRGITVLTKADAVDAETLGVARLELKEFLRGSFLDVASAPLVAVSAKTGAGIEQLKRELARVAAEAPVKDSSARFRLPIDRVFTMKGFGTVITGTLISGAVRKEMELEIFPQKQRARVRGVQVHGVAGEVALAGERTALNLAGPRISTETLARGMTLAEPGVFEPTQRVDVSLSLLSSAKALRNGARVHFHAYTAEAIAQVTLHDAHQLLPGATTFARLKLAEPALLLPGDRFIVRQFSPVITIGGGVVLDATPLPAGKREKSSEGFLRILAQGNASQVLTARVARRGHQGLTREQAIAETGWTSALLDNTVREIVDGNSVVKIGNALIDSAAFEQLALATLQTINDFHSKNPLSPGMSKEELRDRLGLSVPSQIFASLLESLIGEGKLEISGEQVRAAGRTVVMKDEESESKRIIEHAFQSAGLKVPALKEVLAGLPIDKARAQRIVVMLLREKVLVKLSDDLVFHRDALQNLRDSVRAQKSASPRIDVGKFKNLTGVSRKYAIPLLEYLDREHITRRVGDERIIL